MTAQEGVAMWQATFTDLRNAILDGDDQELLDAAKRLAAVERYLIFWEGITVPTLSLSPAHAALRERVLSHVEV
jgi:hypothetical protein